jgi:hypothetical protein
MVVGFAGAASADVQIEPGDFHQGDGGQFTFHVTNTNPKSPLTRVEMRLPEQYPMAEVYPMSAANWAPQQTMRDVDTPLTDRDGAPVEQVVASITWWAMPGLELAPGAQTDLNVSVAGLPATSRLEIGIVETFADGTTANSTASVALAAPLPDLDAAQHAAGTGDTKTSGPAGKSGSNLWWMFGLLVLIGGLTAFALLRQRRDTPAADDDADSTARENTAEAAARRSTPTKATKAPTKTATKAAKTPTKTATRTAKAPTKTATRTAKAPTRTAKRTSAGTGDKRIRASH